MYGKINFWQRIKSLLIQEAPLDNTAYNNKPTTCSFWNDNLSASEQYLEVKSINHGHLTI